MHSAVPDQGRVDPLLGGGERGESQVHLSNYPREIAHQPEPPNFYDRAGAAPRFHAHPSTTKDAQSLSRGKPVATARAPDFVIIFGQKRIEKRKAKETLDINVQQNPASADFVCQICGRACKSRIGLYSLHSRTHPQQH